jgi:hypothetical protein
MSDYAQPTAAPMRRFNIVGVVDPYPIHNEQPTAAPMRRFNAWYACNIQHVSEILIIRYRLNVDYTASRCYINCHKGKNFVIFYHSCPFNYA